MRPEAEAQGATQFETVCAAAFAEFAAREIDVAVVEAGLGGRLDATNVLRSHVVLLTNVGLDHTDVLGETREEIAAEKLAVVQEGTIAVLPDEEFADLAGPNVVVGGAREAAAAFLGRPVEREVQVTLPGRLERNGDEVRDGAHNADGARLARGAARPLRLHRSWSRSCATRTPTRCSQRSPARGRGSSRRRPRTRARCPPTSSPPSPQRHFAEVEIEPDPAARARPRARARPGSRHGLALPSRRSGRSSRNHA